MAWAGIVNRAFSAKTIGPYLRTLPRPAFVKFIVVHNTGAPSLATYRGYANRPTPVSDSQWLRNLEGFYRDKQHWSAGPHWFVTPNDNGLLAFTSSTVRGTHSPSWNGMSLGVEMVGDYQSEPFDPDVQRNAIALLAELHIWLGLSPDTIRFHHEDPETTHKDCPGKNVVKPVLIAAVKAKIKEMQGDDSTPVALLDVPQDTDAAGAEPQAPMTDISAQSKPSFFNKVVGWISAGSGLSFLGYLTSWQVVAILCGFIFLMMLFIIWFFGADKVRAWVSRQVN